MEPTSISAPGCSTRTTPSLRSSSATPAAREGPSQVRFLTTSSMAAIARIFCMAGLGNDVLIGGVNDDSLFGRQ
jgi:hypothetical protein